MVYVFHYGGGLKSPYLVVRLFGQLTAAGWIGVTLFFVLSGFLITGILWDSIGQPHRLRNFYVRRALRILPLYYFALALCAFISIADGGRFVEIQSILLYIPFLQNLPVLANLAQQGWLTLPLYHLWSLAVEEQFYLLWPALLMLPRTRRSALHLTLWTIVVSELFRITIYGLPFFPRAISNHLFDTFLLTHADALAIGAALALALRGPGRAYVQRWSLPALFVGILSYLLTSWYSGALYLTSKAQFTIGLAGVTFAAAAAIPLVLRAGLPRRLCSISPLRFLGRISYGFYIFHILLQPLFDTISLHIAHTGSGSFYQLVRLLVAFPITIVVSRLSYQFLELPFLKLKRYFPIRSTQAPWNTSDFA
jgi:peptidoglycan/LPS O-acetylase OafA/YrhL